jgi:thymidine kinase
MERGSFHANKAEMRKRFWSDIEFTKEEKIFLKNSRIQHFERMKNLRTKLNESQSALFNEIRKSKPDTNKIIQYKTQSLNTQEEIIDESIFFYENLKTKLNDEQMEIINSHLSKKFHSKNVMKRTKHTNDN